MCNPRSTLQVFYLNFHMCTFKMCMRNKKVPSKHIVYVTILPCYCCFADKMILNVGCTFYIYQASLYHMTLTETFICNVTFPLLLKAAWRDVNWKIFHKTILSS